MKVLIVSDIHGGYENMLKVLENEKDFDLMLIMGDILSGYSSNYNELASLLNSFNTKIISVRGNCDNSHLDLLDFNYDNPYVLTSIDNKLIFMTHGHLFDIFNTPTDDYDIYIQGHTHKPKMELVDGKLYLNPGSITYPRSVLGKTYMIYQNNTFYLKDLDNNIIKEIHI